MNDALALLAGTTALRVFLPGFRAAAPLLLGASVRAGLAEPLQIRRVRPAGTLQSTSVVSRDLEEV